MKKKKKIWKRIIMGVGAFFAFLLILAIALPYFLKDEIKELIKNEINDKIVAKADFGQVSLSLFRSFPNLNATVDSIEVKGVGVFADQDLIKIKRLSLDLDLISVIFSSQTAEIKNFSILEPVLNIVVNPDGTANYNIFKSDDEGKKSTNSKAINLQKYSVVNGILTYTDHQNFNRISISNLNHEGKGNFKDKIFLLKTKTNIDKLSFESAGIPYAKDLRVKWDGDLDVDLNQLLFKIAENQLKVNELLLISEGIVRMNEKEVDIDLKLRAPGNSFKELFSLVPNAYIEGFKDVKTEGKFSFSGVINGKYGLEGEEYPNFDFKLKADNGFVKYPSLSLPIEKINANIRIFKIEKAIAGTNINIDPLTFSVGGESFLMKMLVSDLTTDPVTNGEIRGTLNLEALSKAFPMPDVKNLSGKIIADIVFNVSRSLAKKDLTGNAMMSGVNLLYSDLPPVSILSLNADFSNDVILCSGILIKAGKTDFSGTVRIKDPLNYSIKNKTVSFDIDSKSNFVDADEWMASEKTSAPTVRDEYKGIIDLMINKLVLSYRLQIQKLKFEDYDLKKINATGNYKKNVLNLSNTDVVLSDSRMNIKGKLSDIITWALDDQVLTGNLNISSPQFNVDKFMSTDANASPATVEAFALPDKMELSFNTDIDKINYTGKELSGLKGNLDLKDQKIYFNDLTANGMGGNLKLTGLFATPKNSKPEFDMKFSLANMRYEEVYKQVVTFQALAPVAKFLNGIFNADFSFKGKLTDDLSPQLETITAAGLIETINGYIRSFAGTNEIAEKMNIQSIKDIKLDNIKGKFEIVNGVLNVKPFDIKFDDMNFNISGLNRLDKTIEYIVHAKIPRSKIDKIPGGQNVNKGLNFLASQAKAKGLDINLGEIINLDILLSGPFLNPKLKFEYKGNEGEAVKSAVEAKVDNIVSETKTQVNEELEKKKKEAENKAGEIIDSAKNQVETKAKETIEDLKKKAQKELESKLDSAAKSKAKNALDQYNPFKKKK